jgi:hypothetical protein
VIRNVNNVRLYSYSSGTTPQQDTLLDRATNLRFSGCYPGGMYASLTFDLPMRDITATWNVQPNQRLVAMNGLDIVWEGKVTNPGYSLTDAQQLRRVECLGYWGDVMMLRTIQKPWADKRISEDIWTYVAVSAYLKATESRQNNTLTITPKAQAWTNGQYARFRYVAPTGQTIKRVTCDYDFAEGAQAWECGLATSTFAPTDQVTSTGTGSFDRTFATPQSLCYLYWIARANQTPASDGSMRVIFSNIVVYTETGAINLTEIAKDIRALATDLSAVETLIGSNTLDLTPFIADPAESYADILTKAASYGDSSYNAWACGVRSSSLASDRKPILFVEQQPALTDYDYEVSVAEANYLAPAEFDRDINAVRNWIRVYYRSGSGYQLVVTPDDDANLTDAASVAAYGRRDETLTIDTESLTTATNLGRSYLAAHKDEPWRASGGIVLQSYVMAKGGLIVPASEIQPGKRIRVRDYLDDLSGTGMIFLITATDYDDLSEQARLSVGQPDNLDVLMARIGRERN